MDFRLLTDGLFKPKSARLRGKYQTGSAALLVILCGLSWGVFRCDKSGGDTPAEDVGPAQDAGTYFMVEADNTLALSESALEQEFLLQVNQMDQENEQKFSAQRSRIVSFSDKGEALFMLESSEGKVVEADIPSTLILAKFPVQKRERGRIYFDFNKGVSELFVARDYFATDQQGGSYASTQTTVKTTLSYIESAQITAANGLSLRLLAQVEFAVAGNPGQEGELRNPTLAFLFEFSPYQVNENFGPTLSPGQYQMGFFEIYPQYAESGQTSVFAMKFDRANMPIPFALSENTPEEYRQAVRDGILYWNQVLGEELLAAIDAPAGVTAPDLEYNVIQWFDSETAGSAYADFQADPRSGEIRHAQIYMPSMFAVLGRETAWFYLRLFEERETSRGESPPVTIALKNFEPEPVCNFDGLKEMAQLAQLLLQADASDEQYLLASQDFVRLVVAHEVGHTLGLRHNFSGSLGIDYQNNSRGALLQEYLNTGAFPADLIPTASIMDYGATIDELFVGSQIRNQLATAQYDIRALKYLYQNEWLEPVPVFCTDTDAGKYLDCQRFDYGKTPVVHALEEILVQLDPAYLTMKTLFTFVLAKMPQPGLMPTPISQVYLNVDKKAADIMSYRKLLLTAFTAKGLYVRTMKREFPGLKLGEVETAGLRAETIPDIEADVADYLGNNAHGLAVVSDLFFPLSEELVSQWQASFEALLSDPALTAGYGPDGTYYEFSATELEQMKSKADQYFEELQIALVANDVALMNQGNFDITAGDLGQGLIEALSEMTIAYLLKTEVGEYIEAKVTIGSSDQTVWLPVFKYPWAVRFQATALLLSSRVENPDRLWWGRVEAAAVYQEFIAALDEIFLSQAGQTFEAVKIALLNADLNTEAARHWYQENEYIKANYQSK